MAMKRTGDMLGYARVSTADQDAAAQQDRLAEAGAVRTFIDTASAAGGDRPALSQLIGEARPGDTLCVTRLDRLGRSLRELLETVEDLKARDIHFMSLEERIDTASAAGELVFHVFGAIAHFERRLISERTREGLAAARRRGARPGRRPLDPGEGRRRPQAGGGRHDGRPSGPAARDRALDRLQDRPGGAEMRIPVGHDCANDAIITASGPF